MEASITKNSALQALAEEYVSIVKKIEEFKAGEYGTLLELEKRMKEDIKTEMNSAGLKNLDTKLGVVELTVKKGASKLDKEAIMQKLGVENLDEFSTVGDPILALSTTLKN